MGVEPGLGEDRGRVLHHLVHRERRDRARLGDMLLDHAFEAETHLFVVRNV